MSVNTAKVLVLGAGNMGGAVATAIRAAGVSQENLVVHNSSAESTAQAAHAIGATSSWDRYGKENAEAIAQAAVADADVVVLGIKPYQLADVLPALADSLTAHTLVISLAAGATIQKLSELLGGHTHIIRTMPNTPVSVGRGVVALMPAATVSEEHVALARALFEKSAQVVEVPESKVHAVIGASGSSPAFFFLIAEAMIDEAVAQGFTRDIATALVVETMRGSAQLLSETGELPAAARYAVTSPGGTTAQGVAALEKSGIRNALAEAMRAAAETSRAMESDN